jgi:hypothetical protein
MEKMFAVAGMSNLDGKVKVRFANEMARVKVLEKNGHTDVRLVALAAAMTKDAAVAALMVHDAFQDAAAQAVLKAYGDDDKPAKAVNAPKLTLDDMPKRDGKGHFIKRETREEMLLAKLAEMANKNRPVRTAEEQAAIKAQAIVSNTKKPQADSSCSLKHASSRSSVKTGGNLVKITPFCASCLPYSVPASYLLSPSNISLSTYFLKDS